MFPDVSNLLKQSFENMLSGVKIFFNPFLEQWGSAVCPLPGKRDGTAWEEGSSHEPEMDKTQICLARGLKHVFLKHFHGLVFHFRSLCWRSGLHIYLDLTLSSVNL